MKSAQGIRKYWHGKTPLRNLELGNILDKIQILADDRERNSGVIQCFEKRSDVDIEVKRLAVGDYIANGKFVFERKNLRDFAISIFDGRLFRQSSALLNSDYQPIIVLEGNSSQLEGMNVRRSAIQGALIHVSIVLGIPVLRAVDPIETGGLIIQVAKQDLNISSGDVVRYGRRPKGKKRNQLLMLQGIPGIGRKKAMALIDKFESVEKVVNADYEELLAIDGIGEKIADQIRFTVSESSAAYTN